MILSSSLLAELLVAFSLKKATLMIWYKSNNNTSKKLNMDG